MALQIGGTVRHQASGEGLGNVLISNGEHVVSTEGDGSYVLQAELGTHAFVWVSTPDGFRAADRFYRVVSEAGGLDFNLTSEELKDHSMQFGEL